MFLVWWVLKAAFTLNPRLRRKQAGLCSDWQAGALKSLTLIQQSESSSPQCCRLRWPKCWAGLYFRRQKVCWWLLQLYGWRSHWKVMGNTVFLLQRQIWWEFSITQKCFAYLLSTETNVRIPLPKHGTSVHILKIRSSRFTSAPKETQTQTHLVGYEDLIKAAGAS